MLYLDKAIAAVPQEDLSRCMADFVDENGCWKWAKFQHLFPVASCLKIAGIKPPNPTGNSDRIAWGPSKNVPFYISTAYELIEGENWGQRSREWEIVWKWQGPQRVRSFLWLVLHNILLTNEQRKRRHMTDVSTCPRCKKAE